MVLKRTLVSLEIRAEQLHERAILAGEFHFAEQAATWEHLFQLAFVGDGTCDDEDVARFHRWRKVMERVLPPLSRQYRRRLYSTGFPRPLNGIPAPTRKPKEESQLLPRCRVHRSPVFA